MKIKFRPGPTARALAAPTDQSFAGYAGLKRTCVRYKKKLGRNGRPVLRCAEFEKASKVGKHPRCPKGTRLKARDPRGKSPGLIRKVVCVPAPKKRRRSRR